MAMDCRNPGAGLVRPTALLADPQVSAGSITRSQLTEIAKAKMADLNANDIDQATKIIEGSARSMGLQVVEG